MGTSHFFYIYILSFLLSILPKHSIKASEALSHLLVGKYPPAI